MEKHSVLFLCNNCREWGACITFHDNLYGSFDDMSCDDFLAESHLCVWNVKSVPHHRSFLALKLTKTRRVCLPCQLLPSVQVSQQAWRCKLSSLKQSRALCRLIVAQRDTLVYVELSVALARLLPYALFSQLGYSALCREALRTARGVLESGSLCRSPSQGFRVANGHWSSPVILCWKLNASPPPSRLLSWRKADKKEIAQHLR